MPAEDDITDSLEALRVSHEQAINMLVPDVSENEDDPDDYSYDDPDQDLAADPDDPLDQSSVSVVGSVLSHASSLPVGASALSTPPSSVAGPKTGRSRTLASLRLQPQFNLDSAGRLLRTFVEVMLKHFHCVVVGEGDTVSGMARERPFVLLAVLAAASGSRTLQGHSLYDEEFRKVLGLKFVAGGERTVELLQGLVIYIAWYPFHLRPKNKQAFQYIRMLVDIVTDLELDEDPGTDSMEVAPPPERLDQIRLYLASYYLASAVASTWGRPSLLTYTDYTARCSDLLQRHSPHCGDHVLAWQVRLERLVEETNDLRRTQRGRSQSEYQIGLMIRGMETQLAEWEARIDPAVAATPSVRIAVLFTRVFLSGAPLLKLPSVKLSPPDGASSFSADPARLKSVIPALHALYEYFLSLEPGEVNSFIGIEWGALILSVILGFRMSFPLALCPEWDDKAAREAVRFGEYVDRLCKMGGDAAPPFAEGKPDTSGNNNATPQSQSMDVLTASKIVLEMVKKKFTKRVARLEGQQQQQHDLLQHQQLIQQQQQIQPLLTQHHPMIPIPIPTAAPATSHDATLSGCPIMDGSLEPYYPYWDETFTSHHLAPGGGSGGVYPAAGAGAGAARAGLQQQPGLEEGGGAPDDLWTAMTMGWAVEGMAGVGMGMGLGLEGL
ncbi:hypothetical protein C8A05DRAFT_34807 [Staphylotrichum tortipilum]|uniref:Uncharacterized protein n=1 Tax=Staphylotrichum tortipilum TaxID=2831512 RepID=A0AAN6RTG1_9PEZI|nr:hypothetical protein C8A05DRAFT_34807 [Staphylotrichum longicolle]